MRVDFHKIKNTALYLSFLVVPISATSIDVKSYHALLIPFLSLFLYQPPPSFAFIRKEPPKILLLVSIVLFLVWCGITSYWDTGRGSLTGVTRLTIYTACGLYMLSLLRDLAHGAVNRLVTSLAAGMLIAEVMVFGICCLDRLEFPSLLPISSIDANYGAVLISVLMWPVLFFLRNRERKYLFWAILVLAAPSILISQILASKIAFLSGAALFFLGWKLPRLTIIATAGSIAALLLFSPIIVRHIPPPDVSMQWKWLPTSSFYRLIIWSYTGERIAEKPILGWGYDNARELSRKKDTITVTFPSGETELFRAMPSHPHNAALQMWLDVGGIGVLLFSLILGITFRELYRDKASAAARACTLTTVWSLFIVAMVSYNFWDRKWQLTVWLAITLCYRILRESRIDTPPFTAIKNLRIKNTPSSTPALPGNLLAVDGRGADA